MHKSVKEILAVIFLSPSKENETNEHRAWILESTDAELDEYISLTTQHPILHPMALAERQKRHFKHLSKAAEPHWTIIRSYRLLQISVGLATLAIIITVLAWWFPKEKRIPISQPASANQSISTYIPAPVSSPANLLQTKTAIKQTSSPAIYTTAQTNILGH